MRKVSHHSVLSTLPFRRHQILPDLYSIKYNKSLHFVADAPNLSLAQRPFHFLPWPQCTHARAVRQLGDPVPHLHSAPSFSSGAYLVTHPPLLGTTLNSGKKGCRGMGVLTPPRRAPTTFFGNELTMDCASSSPFRTYDKQSNEIKTSSATFSVLRFPSSHFAPYMTGYRMHFYVREHLQHFFSRPHFVGYAKKWKDGLRDIAPARPDRRDRDTRNMRLPHRTPQHKCHMCTLTIHYYSGLIRVQ